MGDKFDEELNSALSKMAKEGQIELNGEVVSLPVDRRGAFLCSVNLYRSPSGHIRAELRDMLPGQIEGVGDAISERFLALSQWMQKGAESFDRQSKLFDDKDNPQ